MHYSDYDFSYLIPPAEVFDVQHDDYYIHHGEKNHSVRKIFDCVPYTDYEKQKLAEFENMIRQADIHLPSWWTTALTMKYIYSAKFALEQSFENLKTYLKWLEHENRKTIPPKSLELLKEGLLYLGGRDKQYRPVLVINVYKVDLNKMTMDDFTEALCALCSVVEKYCFVPGKVENWVIIVETNSVSMWNFPFKILQKLVTATSIYFTSTLDKLYLMNPSRLLKGSWTLFQKLLHPETAAKISMLDKDEYTKLLEKIPIDQLEEIYGGTLPKPAESYWPPRKTLNKPPYRKPHENPRKDPRKALGLETDGVVSQEELLVSGRTPNNRDRNLEASSVYYDFEDVYMDLPKPEDYKPLNGNSQWTSPEKDGLFYSERGYNSNGKTTYSYQSTKSPGQYQEGLVLEAHERRSKCCGLRRGSSKSDNDSGCNLF